MRPSTRKAITALRLFFERRMTEPLIPTMSKDLQQRLDSAQNLIMDLWEVRRDGIEERKLHARVCEACPHEIPGLRPIGPDGKSLVPERKDGKVSYTRAYEEMNALEGIARAITAGLLDKKENGRTAIENLMSGYHHHPKTVEEAIIKEIHSSLRAVTPSGEIYHAELVQCCERDHDHDGNCDRHAAPGVPRNLEELASKARAFDLLAKHIADMMPPQAAIRQLSGVPFVEAVKDYEFVLKTKTNS